MQVIGLQHQLLYSLLHPSKFLRDNLNDNYNNRIRLGSSELRSGDFTKGHHWQCGAVRVRHDAGQTCPPCD